MKHYLMLHLLEPMAHVGVVFLVIYLYYLVSHIVRLYRGGKGRH